jgi:hypothetical protein
MQAMEEADRRHVQQAQASSEERCALVHRAEEAEEALGAATAEAYRREQQLAEQMAEALSATRAELEARAEQLLRQHALDRQQMQATLLAQCVTPSSTTEGQRSLPFLPVAQRETRSQLLRCVNGLRAM